MPLDNAFFTAWTPRALGLLRIVTGYLFLCHGMSKFFGIPQPSHPVELFTLAGAAGALELVGGFLILIGLFTRPAAFILSGEMAFAYFIAHAGRGNPIFPITNGGELAVMYCFVFLFFAAAGSGAFGIDSMRRKADVTLASGSPPPALP